jgi:hypothetical protein
MRPKVILEAVVFLQILFSVQLQEGIVIIHIAFREVGQILVSMMEKRLDFEFFFELWTLIIVPIPQFERS